MSNHRVLGTVSVLHCGLQTFQSAEMKQVQFTKSFIAYCVRFCMGFIVSSHLILPIIWWGTQSRSPDLIEVKTEAQRNEVMPKGQTTNKLQKLAQNPGLLTLNLGLLFSVPWSLNHLTWKYMCLHLHQTNEATGILILVRSNNVKVPSPTGLFLLCLSCLRNRCFGICCVNASFNVTTESGKQWHGKMFI